MPQLEPTLRITSRSFFLAHENGRDMEVQTLKLPHTAGRKAIQRLLTDEAEYGHWELARLRRYRDGSSQVWLRRPVIKVRSTLHT